MSLAWRILLVVLLLNLVVVGSLQTALFAVQQEWLRRERSERSELLDATLVNFLERFYTAELIQDDTQVRELVRAPITRDFFDDVVVTGGRIGYGAMVWLNPRGAVHRDPDQFSMDAIQEGMRRAGATDRPVPVGGGYCRTVRQDGEVAGYLWFRPSPGAAPGSNWPFWLSVVAVLAGTLLFGALLYWVVVRTIGRPLDRVREAAAQVGAGAHGVRVPAPHGMPELAQLAASFNSMAEKVQGHTADLERAVREAVAATEARERALVVSSRLAAIGTLAAGIAHEINNPLAGMQNAVHRLLQAPDLGERQRTYLQLVLDGLGRVARTTRRVLDFSPRSVDARPFALQTAVDGARALVEHRLHQQGVRFAARLDEDLPQLYGDAHEIQQVLLNLLLNSLDALGQRGSGGSISIAARRDGDRVRILVEDDGPGMDPADLARVLDPFFSRKDRPDASGLGMFISYSIVQNHGGELLLDSAPGRGFRVTLTLPAAAPEAGPAPGAGTAGRGPA